MKRLLTVAAVLSTTMLAFGVVASMKLFDTVYKIGPDAKLHEAKCLVCHTSPKGKTLNPYGKDLEAVMKAKGTKKLSEDILRSVEKLDSDKDGMSNIDEIKADRMPGEK